MAGSRSLLSRVWPLAATGVAVAALGAGGWLWSENRRLERELADARRAPVPAAPAPAAAVDPDADDEDVPAATDGTAGRRRVRNLFDALARVGQREEKEDAPPPDPMERRRRRREWLRAVLGRHDGETPEAYAARVAPLVTGALEIPRQRVESWRDKFEQEAGITDDQRSLMDGAIADAQADLINLANAAVADGSISPYRVSNRGLLEYAGQANTVIAGLDERLRAALTQEQWAALSSSDFDYLEYIALTTQWESLAPPPPAP